MGDQFLVAPFPRYARETWQAWLQAALDLLRGPVLPGAGDRIPLPVYRVGGLLARYYQLLGD